MFDAPSTNTAGDTCRPADVLGHLLIVIPRELKRDFVTKHGPTDAVVVDVADLDTDTVYFNAMFFAKALVNALKDKIGASPVLARMTQGVGKNGNNPPWLLQDATGDASVVARAEAWLDEHSDFQSEAPVPSVDRPSFMSPPNAEPGVVYAQGAPSTLQLDPTKLSPEVMAMLQRQQGGAA